MSPRLSGVTVSLPARFARVGSVAGAGRYSDARGAGAGVASFLLPCGSAQAVQLFALSSALYAPHAGSRVLPLGTGVNVLEFTPERPGRLHYWCAMGMFSGVIDVVEAAGA